MLERRNSIVNARELRLSCTNPSINSVWPVEQSYIPHVHLDKHISCIMSSLWAVGHRKAISNTPILPSWNYFFPQGNDFLYGSGVVDYACLFCLHQGSGIAYWAYINGSMKKEINSSALGMELGLSCINPSICESSFTWSPFHQHCFHWNSNLKEI